MVTKLDPAKRLTLVDKLLPVLREKVEQAAALLDELEAVTGGAATVGERLKDLENHFAELWQWRYGEPYVWANYGRSRAQWKGLMRKLPHAILKARVGNFIRNAEPFFVDRRHPFELFVATINQHATPREHELTDTPVGCKHSPPCRDQFEHTRKRQTEQTA